jgi:protein SCO1/2
MDKKIFWVGLGSFSLIALVALATYIFSGPASFRGTSYSEPYPIAPQIELKQADGETYRLSDQKGKIILLFFGYTSCPDVCPTTMAELKLVREDLGNQAGDVQVIFVSVDPEHDTAEMVQEYVSRFDPSFIGLSGSTNELTKIWDEYGVFRETVKADSALGYTVNHTARVTLIDADGKMRLSYGFQTPVEDIVHDLKILLK